MVNNEQKISNRISREKGTNVIYNDLLDRQGPLNSKENKKYSRDIFILALAFGYMNNIKLPIESKDNFINKENFGEFLPALINSLAINNSNKGIEILADNSGSIFQTAEEYANGGLEFLNSEYVESPDEFIEMLRIKILDLNKNNRILDKLEELDL